MDEGDPMSCFKFVKIKQVICRKIMPVQKKNNNTEFKKKFETNLVQLHGRCQKPIRSVQCDVHGRCPARTAQQTRSSGYRIALFEKENLIVNVSLEE
jgi:hypothetical protein